jgi:DNA mismatch endonuclease, patch repair protein
MKSSVPLTRSQIMSRVRGRGNKSTEQKLAALFKKADIKGWRRHLPLPGTPDFAFPKLRLAIFVDGCFWHGCPRCYTRPATNRDFWDKKLRDNCARDRRVNRELRSKGWRVIRIWAHSLKIREATLAKRFTNIVKMRHAELASTTV